MYYMRKHEGVDVVLAVEHLSIPTRACLIDSLKNTLVAFYKFKVLRIKSQKKRKESHRITHNIGANACLRSFDHLFLHYF